MTKISDDYIRRTEKLWEMAEQDEVYCIWKSEYKKYEKRFKKIEWFLPKKLARFFREYMGCDAMRLNRVISLTCMCMEFTGEKPFGCKNQGKKNVIEFMPEKGN